MTAMDVLQPAIVFLGAGLCSAMVARAVRISPIVAYILAGVATGPYALNLAPDNAATHFLAELGVVFLLFDIGLHFSLGDIRKRKSDMLGLAPAQMILTGGAFALIAKLTGLEWPIAIAVGLSLAMSSTAVVMRVLADKDRPDCPVGRSATAVLVAQDIVAIFLLAFAASIQGDPAHLVVELAQSAGFAFIAFIIAALLGRFILRPVFQALSTTQNEDVFTVLSLFIVLSAGLATDALGLSLTLGAFLAGMAIADTPYRQLIRTEIKPFRSLLLGLFFISVGAQLNIPALAETWLFVLMATTAIITIKTVLTFIAAKLNGWSTHGGVQVAFLMSQGSEFTLVVTAALALVIPSAWSTTLVAAVALSLLIAPSWAEIGDRLARAIVQRRSDANNPSVITPNAQDHPVLVFGMTAEGRLAVDALREFQIPFVALDLDHDRFISATADGYKVVYGDAADLRLMDSVGANYARAFVLGAPRYEISRSITPAVREKYPNLLRFVAVENQADFKRHSELGMHPHISGGEPAGVELVTDLLMRLEVNPNDVSVWVKETTKREELFDHGDQTDPAETAKVAA